MSVVVVSWICSRSSNITILQVNKMHAQNFTYHLLAITLKVVFLYNLFHWYTPYNSVSDSLRIVLHYYIQYEVRFSLSYLKKKSISPLISRFFPFSCHILLISFYIVCLITYRKYVWCYHHQNNATSLVIQDDPLLAPIYPKMIFKFYFVYHAKSTDMKYCCIF